MKLQRALLSLGEFETALSNVSTWLNNAQSSLDQPEPLHADPKTIEAEIARLKVTVNPKLDKEKSLDYILWQKLNMADSQRIGFNSQQQ